MQMTQLSTHGIYTCIYAHNVYKFIGRQDKDTPNDQRRGWIWFHSVLKNLEQMKQRAEWRSEHRETPHGRGRTKLHRMWWRRNAHRGNKCGEARSCGRAGTRWARNSRRAIGRCGVKPPYEPPKNQQSFHLVCVCLKTATLGFQITGRALKKSSLIENKTKPFCHETILKKKSRKKPTLIHNTNTSTKQYFLNSR